MTEPRFKKDYESFTNADETQPPNEVSNKILNLIKDDLKPNHVKVFSKLLGIQTFIGVLTLLFCPQFNLSLTNNYELFHYFHNKFGANICTAICGSIFIGSGALLASYVLRFSEVKKIAESKFLYYFSISTIAVASFSLISPKVYLEIIPFWFIGAYLSGITLFEINKQIRFKVFSY